MECEVPASQAGDCPLAQQGDTIQFWGSRQAPLLSNPAPWWKL